MKKKIIKKIIIIFAPVIAGAFIFIIMAGAVIAALPGGQGSNSEATASGTTSTANYTGKVGDVSKNLLAFIESWEGYVGTGYRGTDSWNVTIGYGHVELPGESFTYLSKQQAEQLLVKDLETQGYIASAQRQFAACHLKQNQLDALISLDYNLGTNIWPEINLTNDIKHGAPNNVLEHDFEALDHCGGQVISGLSKRRKAEYTLFTTGAYVLN